MASKFARSVALTLIDQPFQSSPSLASREVGHVIVMLSNVDKPFALDVADGPDVVL